MDITVFILASAQCILQTKIIKPKKTATVASVYSQVWKGLQFQKTETKTKQDANLPDPLHRLQHAQQADLPHHPTKIFNGSSEVSHEKNKWEVFQDVYQAIFQILNTYFYDDYGPYWAISSPTKEKINAVINSFHRGHLDWMSLSVLASVEPAM